MPNKCPECGSPAAYIGLSQVSCRNVHCKFYDVKQVSTCLCCGSKTHYDEMIAESERKIAQDGLLSNTVSPDLSELNLSDTKAIEAALIDCSNGGSVIDTRNCPP
jgi:hypothetical protein